jgi:microcin C transport system ATP-binding protein
MNRPLLTVENLTVRFGTAGPAAVENVSFNVNPGETLALVGESGSGKSVSALAILGLLPRRTAITGQIYLNGNAVIGATDNILRDLRGTIAAIIFQEPMTALNPLHTIGQQVGELLKRRHGLRGKALEDRVVALLTEVGIDRPAERLDAYPHQLSGGQRQRVMIAAALAGDPALLIADEPTTALDVTLQVQILALLKELQRKRGMALLLITHDLGIVRQMADRVAVMQRGKLVEDGQADKVLNSPAHPYTKALLDAEPVGQPSPLAADAPLLLEATDVKVWFPIRKGVFRRTVGHIRGVDGISLALRQGETLGIVGESGSGKSTLGYALMGLIPSQGHVSLMSLPISRMDSRQLRPHRKQFQIVFQDPYGALSPRLTVGDIVGEGLDLHGLAKDATEREARIRIALTDVGLDPDIGGRYPHEFSGGQRQRIAIARALILDPRLIVLDEPTSALDRSVQLQVIDLLRDLQKRYGLSYLFISHDLAVVRAMSHRILVMRHGKVVEEGPADRLFSQPQQAYTQTLIAAARLETA